MKVCRVLIMDGPKEWVEDVLKRCFVQPDKPVVFQLLPGSIREISREVIEE